MASDDATALRNAKAALIGCVGLLTFAASLVPWCFRKLFRRSPLDALNVLSALSAGIVFGAFMTHMLPSAGENFSTYLEIAYPDPRSEWVTRLVKYPWAFLVAGLVTTLLVAVDRTIVAHGVHGDEAVELHVDPLTWHLSISTIGVVTSTG